MSETTPRGVLERGAPKPQSGLFPKPCFSSPEAVEMEVARRGRRPGFFLLLAQHLEKQRQLRGRIFRLL